EIVARYTSEGTSQKAEEEFDRIFIRKDAPEEMEEYRVAQASPLVDIMVDAGLAPSKGEAKRLVQGGGVSLDGDKVSDIALVFTPGDAAVLKVGKRRFLRLIAANTV
ncbi:MAG: tyrosine--tRNA ligase, partial [bacterium]|nr:tyrosine--tRNA ligase [Candidatus Kapabacteria bacterium]